MSQPHDNDERTDPRAPQELIDDLRALYRAEVPVPAEVDRAVGRMARRLAGRRPVTVLLRRLAPLAAAAGLLLALGVWTLLPAPVQTPLAVRQDVDGNGRVDILDAFAVARRVESGPRPPEAWDLNGDGAVDRADVDEIAMAAVSLKKGVL